MPARAISLSNPSVDVAFVSIDALSAAAATDQTLSDRMEVVARPQEIHVLARTEIGSLADLAGKKVSFGPVGGSAAATAAALFKALGISVEAESLDASAAIEWLKQGTIDAVGGKPYLSSAPFRRIRASNSCPFPSAFPSKRPICRPVSDSATIPISFNLAAATSMVLLAARGDPPSAERVAHFVEVLFPRFAELQVPERHPKWREVNLAASLPGFSRTEAAAAWLNARAAETGTKPIVANAGAVQPASVPEAAMTKGDQEALFKRFIGWRRSKDH
jgi:hypothetical protein